MKQIPYYKLKSYLMREHGYTEEEAIHSIKELRKANPKIRQAFAVFWKTGKLPDKPILNMNAKSLMKERGMDELGALLAISWLDSEPRSARWTLMHPINEVKVSKSDIELLYRIARNNNWELDKDISEEDTSDISV